MQIADEEIERLWDELQLRRSIKELEKLAETSQFLFRGAVVDERYTKKALIGLLIHQCKLHKDLRL